MRSLREKSDSLRFLGEGLLCGIVVVALVGGLRSVHGQTTTGFNLLTVIAPLTVSNVNLNNGSSITLTANATTSVTVSFTVSGGNGCGPVFFSGNVTTTLFRSGVSSTCAVADPASANVNSLYCYELATSTHNCASADSSASANATSTFNVWYFAQATDASSSFSAQNWNAYVYIIDSSSSVATSTDSAGEELNTLLAINITTSSINYGTVLASSTTGAVNQVTTSTNAGNSTTTLRLSALATLTSGSRSIATTSQRYATSSFTFYGLSVALQQTPTDVNGYKLTAPTSTTNVQSPIFWGLEVPAGTATGTYNGTTLFTAIWAA